MTHWKMLLWHSPGDTTEENKEIRTCYLLTTCPHYAGSFKVLTCGISS